ncbi:MAG: hypothetical protein C0417_09810 [Chlorobiaceae bacterium]|nr:hypothetical protein [Chlorobiaceae bacterium]
MASLRGRKSSAIGIFVDGLELKLAKLSIKKGNVVIDELQSASLVTKLEERQVANIDMDNLSDTGETFALGGTEPAAESSGSNSNVLLGLISKYDTNDYVFSYSITEPSIYYHTLESDFGLEKKKLKQRILDELRSVRAVQPAPDAIDYFYSVEKNLVCVVREDGVSLLNLLEDIKPFLGKRLPRISLIEIGDVALMNLTRANYGFAPDEITTIIYIGAEFTRLIFMKGTEFFHFAPVLGEGYDSPNIQNTVYSRLLLEQDNMGIPRIDKIFIAGESKKINFEEFMKEQLPDVAIQYLLTPQLDATSLPPEIQQQIPEFAIPIATAWKVLDDDHPGFYPTNLLPETVREGQRAFKLAWHGYVLLMLVFLSSFFFTTRYATVQREITLRQRTLLQLEDKIGENEKMKTAIGGLEEQINRFNTALAVYDSLIPGADRWNKTIAQLTKGVDDLGATWITELRAQPGGAMAIQGYALYRGRIPRIAALFENTTLTKVEVREIRPNTPPVYNFMISIPPQPEKPATQEQQPAAGTKQ